MILTEYPLHIKGLKKKKKRTLYRLPTEAPYKTRTICKSTTYVLRMAPLYSGSLVFHVGQCLAVRTEPEDYLVTVQVESEQWTVRSPHHTQRV